MWKEGKMLLRTPPLTPPSSLHQKFQYSLPGGTQERTFQSRHLDQHACRPPIIIIVIITMALLFQFNTVLTLDNALVCT